MLNYSGLSRLHHMALCTFVNTLEISSDVGSTCAEEFMTLGLCSDLAFKSNEHLKMSVELK
jgi:hypothetical protein